MTVFWNVAPFSMVEVYEHFRGACCLHHQGDDDLLTALMTRASSTSEMSVNYYQTTWHNIPEDSHLQTQYCENLKSQSY
jgi:hypothetical protein